MNSVFKTEDLAKAFQEITDTFSGTDGGVRFVRFRIFLENLERQSLNYDPAADEILDIVKRFDRLIQIANEQPLA